MQTVGDWQDVSELHASAPEVSFLPKDDMKRFFFFQYCRSGSIPPTVLTARTLMGTSEMPSNRFKPIPSLYCSFQGMRRVFCCTFLLENFRCL